MSHLWRFDSKKKNMFNDIFKGTKSQLSNYINCLVTLCNKFAFVNISYHELTIKIIPKHLLFLMFILTFTNRLIKLKVVFVNKT